MVESRPVGPLVEPCTAPWPARTVHDEGRFVRLEPLDAARHGPALWRHVAGADHIWDYMFDGPHPDEASLSAGLARMAASEAPLYWAVVDRASGEALGYAALLRSNPAQRTIEVGDVLFSPALQRTPGATEATALLGAYAFALGYRRFEWKCNALNAPSRAAAERLGFTFEGVFRQHMIVKGRNRDTAWFSMLDSEWAAIKGGFDRWLAADNFDADGRQKRRLAELRAEAHS